MEKAGAFPLGVKMWQLVVALGGMIFALGGCSSSVAEPSDEELEAAVRHRFVATGETRGAHASTHVEGLSIKEVRKIGCEPDQGESGVVCSYESWLGVAGSSEDEAWAETESTESVSLFLSVIREGKREISEYHRDRFVKGWDGWEII